MKKSGRYVKEIVQLLSLSIKKPDRDISLPWFSIISPYPYSERPKKKDNQFILKISFYTQIISISEVFL